MRGFQAEGAAPLVTGEPFPDPETKATAIRIGNPASWKLADAAAARVRRPVRAPSPTTQILAAQRELAASDGVFVEPASAAGVAGLLAGPRPGRRRTPAARSSSPSPATASRTPPPRSRAFGPLVESVVDADVTAAAEAAGLAVMARRGRRSSVECPSDLREPGSRLRLARPRPRPARRAGGRAGRLGPRRRRDRRRSRRRAARRGPPGGSRHAPRLRRPGRTAARAAAHLPQRHPARPGPGFLLGGHRRRTGAGPGAGRRWSGGPRRRGPSRARR